MQKKIDVIELLIKYVGQLVLVALVALTYGQLAGGGETSEARPGFVRTRGRWLVDDQDRVLILHGINLSGRSKRPPFLPQVSREEVAALRKWGFNSVRFLIVWEAVEPQPGKYDDAYLDKVVERLSWCREAGLRVVLDMHQDIFARKYGGDGAPDWACLDDGIPFTRVPGAWYLGYSAPAVICAFDSFWANKPGPEGVGIQDRFISAWQHVARRFRGDTNIIGYDLLNEPYYGSHIYAAFVSVAMALGRELGPATQVRFLKFMTNSKGAVEFVAEALRELKKKDVLWEALDTASRPAQEFERTLLQPFYDRLVAGIRKVDPRHICFFEAAGGGLSATRFLPGLDAPKGPEAVPFENVAFAPHHYDFSIDLHFPYDGTAESVRKELSRATSAGDRMGVPTWFGEWGAAGRTASEANRLVQDHLDAFDKLLCGWAWWDYTKRLGGLPFGPMLGRPYAEVIAGTPIRMQCTEKSFVLEFKPLPKGGETMIWIPPGLKEDTSVKLAGAGRVKSHRDKDGSVHVVCPHNASNCTVSIRIAPKGQ